MTLDETGSNYISDCRWGIGKKFQRLYQRFRGQALYWRQRLAVCRLDTPAIHIVPISEPEANCPTHFRFDSHHICISGKSRHRRFWCSWIARVRKREKCPWNFPIPVSQPEIWLLPTAGHYIYFRYKAMSAGAGVNANEELHLENMGVAFGICLFMRHLEVNKRP